MYYKLQEYIKNKVKDLMYEYIYWKIINKINFIKKINFK